MGIKNLIVLSISRYYLKQLEETSKKSLPAEACAILLGKNTPINEYIIKKIVIMNNMIKNYDYFEVNPSTLLDVYTQSKSLNLDVVAIFHSHPSLAYPSKTDIAYMEINPVIWLIYSTKELVFRAFILDEQKKIIEVSINQIRE